MKQFRDTPYYVTEDGKVFRNGRERKLQIVKEYVRVTLSINNIQQTYFVHRMVAEVYIPNPDNKPEVNHDNGIKSDNRVVNLEWNTRKENALHSTRILKKNIGIDCYRSKLSEEEVRYIKKHCIKFDKEFGYNALGRKFNVHYRTITKIINGKTWVNPFS